MPISRAGSRCRIGRAPSRRSGSIVIRHKVSAEQRVDWSSARRLCFVRNRLYA